MNNTWKIYTVFSACLKKNKQIVPVHTHSADGAPGLAGVEIHERPEFEEHTNAWHQRPEVEET